MREIVAAIGATFPERVTVKKSARLGYTKSITMAIGAKAKLNPGPAILLVPTKEDATDTATDEIEPMFEENECLRGVLKPSRANAKPNMLRKRFLNGGTLKIIAARTPRALRRNNCRDLYCDEVDGMQITKEGDALALAIKRTMSERNRKIVMGSTPTEAEISRIDQEYEKGSRETFQVPCPECGVFNQIKLKHLEWQVGEDEDDMPVVFYKCPHCTKLIHERFKMQMIEAGRWVPQNPERMLFHRSFHINALVSPLANATWPQLVKEYLEAKRAGPVLLMPFYNTVLGETYSFAIKRVDAAQIAERVEAWGLATEGRKTIIPACVLLITVGADTQDDRIEATVIGHRLEGSPLILGKVQFDGNTLDEDVWKEFDKWLKTKWRHELGWKIGIDACAVDSGGREGRTQVVYDFCYKRAARRIYAIKGADGPRPTWKKATKVRGDMRVYIVGIDNLKSEIMDRLAREPFSEEGVEDTRAFRYSDNLELEWFVQATNEIRRVKFLHNRPIISFEPKREGAPVEALDCLVYGLAVRTAPAVRAIDMRARLEWEPVPEDEVEEKPKPRGMADWAGAFNG